MNLLDKISYGSRIFKKSGPLIQLTFFITSRCNLKCQHCFYWKELNSDYSHELTVEEIEKIAKSLPRLLVLSLTGGEPFVREDVGEIYAIFARHTRPHIITISTNGFYKDRMHFLIPKMLTDFPNTNLIIYLSIDGPEKIHDEIRGEGAYKNAVDALEMMQPLRKTFKNFSISISMTSNRINEDYLQKTFQEFADSKLADNVNIAFVRGNPRNPIIGEATVSKYRELVQLKMETIYKNKLKYPNLFMSKLLYLKDCCTYKIVEEILENDSYILPCMAGSLMGILYANGNIQPCEMLDSALMGNIRDFNYNLPQLWVSPQARAVREQIKNGCYCTFECAMSSSILFNPKYLAKLAIKTLFPRHSF